VQLDRPQADVETFGDDLVRFPGGDVRKDVPFFRRQAFVAGANLVDAGLNGVKATVGGEAVADGFP
jgi:hypothetical protein